MFLIDARDLPPEPEPEPERHGVDVVAALGMALAWVFPWPFIVAWLFLGAVELDNLLGAAFAWAATMTAFWRLLKICPGDGLDHHSQ